MQDSFWQNKSEILVKKFNNSDQNDDKLSFCHKIVYLSSKSLLLQKKGGEILIKLNKIPKLIAI